jgi:hypothetical protein
MMPSYGLRRLAALAAAFGIALQALWPAIAQARPSDSVSVPICSVDGTRHEIELPLGKTQDDGSQHCKLCVLGLDKIAVAPELPFFVGNGNSEQFTEAENQNLKPNTAFLARPRAPPQAS